MDVDAEFEIDKEAKEKVNGTDAEYVCSTSGGAAERGALGPFGLLVLADNDQSEQTPVYFYIAKGTDGNFKTFFCSDLSRFSFFFSFHFALFDPIFHVKNCTVSENSLSFCTRSLYHV